MREDLQKHTMYFFAGDYEKVQELFPDHGAGPVIRSVIRRFIEQCEAGTAAIPNVEIDL